MPYLCSSLLTTKQERQLELLHYNRERRYIANETSLLRTVRYQRDKKGCFFAVSGLSNYNMNQFRTRNMAVTPRAQQQWNHG
ncbi:hypothetical protein FRX31_017394 [Thalictrum thalictroides]|uniref:Uncharacterized protein n=1 Tax=Thalictrum thalictroides TaxID=46969 RepID=A0A7J6W701_THATH|nr:hypothetical protein FRX31_017394 [Thalictrum thalictroides]